MYHNFVIYLCLMTFVSSTFAHYNEDQDNTNEVSAETTTSLNSEVIITNTPPEQTSEAYQNALKWLNDNQGAYPAQLTYPFVENVMSKLSEKEQEKLASMSDEEAQKINLKPEFREAAKLFLEVKKADYGRLGEMLSDDSQYLKKQLAEKEVQKQYAEAVKQGMVPSYLQPMGQLSGAKHQVFTLTIASLLAKHVRSPDLTPQIQERIKKEMDWYFMGKPVNLDALIINSDFKEANPIGKAVVTEFIKGGMRSNERYQSEQLRDRNRAAMEQMSKVAQRPIEQATKRSFMENVANGLTGFTGSLSDSVDRGSAASERRMQLYQDIALTNGQNPELTEQLGDRAATAEQIDSLSTLSQPALDALNLVLKPLGAGTLIGGKLAEGKPLEAGANAGSMILNGSVHELINQRISLTGLPGNAQDFLINNMLNKAPSLIQ